MELGELEFKAEDFNLIGWTKQDAERAAHHSNRILREKLSKAPEVFGSLLGDTDQSIGFVREGTDTHRARLVCIEEINSTKIEVKSDASVPEDEAHFKSPDGKVIGKIKGIFIAEEK